MGRYLDLARDVKAAENCGKEAASTPQWEEKARSRFLAGKGYEINEISPIGGVPLCPPGGRAVLLQVPDGVPEAWVQGIADLLAMPSHPDWPEAAWKTLQDDALGFLKEWAAQAHALGWGGIDLFGVHAEAPHARLDGMGLVPLLSGRPVVALTEDSAAIKANSGGTLTFRIRNTWPPGRLLIWDLEGPS